MDLDKISTKLKISRKKVYKAVAILELHAKGYTDTEIAETLGMSQSTISRSRGHLGLPPLKIGRPRKSGVASINAEMAGYVKWSRSAYTQHSDGLLVYNIDGETDLPRRVRVVSNTDRIPRAN